MLRVGLTGGLGSGKSLVAAIFRRLGAEVMEADAVGRAMMQPGELVYREIVRVFGPGVVRADGALDRRRLAELAFAEGHLEALNAIVHPAVIAEQQRWMDALAQQKPEAVAVYESALLFEASRDAVNRTGGVQDWQQRFDRGVDRRFNRHFDRRILITAPEPLRIARYVARIAGTHPSAETRSALEQEARQRMAAQMTDEEKMPLSDTILRNDTSVEEITRQAEALYTELRALAAATKIEK